MADSGDITRDAPSATLPPDAQAAIMLLQEQLQEARTLIATLAREQDAQSADRNREREVPGWRQDIDKDFRGPKMAKPDVFSGRMDETEVFINNCWMYVCGHPNDFPSERTAIMWAASYMKEGSACEWRDDFLEDAKDGDYRFETL